MSISEQLEVIYNSYDKFTGYLIDHCQGMCIIDDNDIDEMQRVSNMIRTLLDELLSYQAGVLSERQSDEINKLFGGRNK